MNRRTLTTVFSISTLALTLVDAQTLRPRTSPTQPVQGVSPRPVPQAAMMASVDPALFKGLKYRLVGPSRGGRVTTVTGVPSEPRTFYMGVASGGVFRTSDGGKTWRKVLFLSDEVGAMDVELQPGNPNVVYAWMSHLERKPWTIISGSRDGGFYKSTDGGEHFTKITAGLPGDLIGKTNLAVTAANPDRIYALVEARPGGGLYRSDDSGQTWALINSQGSLI